MNKYKKGNVRIVVLVLVLILAVGGVVFWQSQNNKEMVKTEIVESPEKDAMEKKEAMKEESEKMEKKDESMTAKVLAKKNSSFSEYNQKDYEKAVAEGKIIYLEFYANWCPICRAQEEDLIEGINKLTRADVAGFRVNFKDDQTDEGEKALAAKYKIPYQHHKIVVKDGKVVIDSAETWDAQTLISELTKL